MCFSKKYKLEDLVILHIYRFTGCTNNTNHFEKCYLAITTKDKIKNVVFGSYFEKVEALNGTTYSAYYNGRVPFSALDATALLSELDKEEIIQYNLKNKKKLTLNEIFQLEHDINQSFDSSQNPEEEFSNIDAKDLF